MSFSQQIKEELSLQLGASRHCQIAEMAAMISACGVYSVRPGGRLFLVWQSENILVARKISDLLTKTFDVIPDLSVMGSGEWKKSRVYTLAVRRDEDVKRILKATKFLQENGAIRDLDLPVSSLLLRSVCCRRAFLRGTFISSGSVSDPRKSYHFEIACQSREKAKEICHMIREFGQEAKMVERKKYHVVYVKEGNAIADLLNIMGAHKSLMDLENVRILRGISGNVNRQVNCETANLNKTVSAAVEQARDITYIREKMGLESLPDPLREMAWVRLENPDMPLKDLGNLLHPPVGKSGVNHRLRKLKEIAAQYRREHGDLEG